MILEKKWYWSLVPLAGRHHYATTVGSRIFLPPGIYRRWQAGRVSPRVEALIEHEKTHVRQWETYRFYFVLGYLCSRTRRLEFEAEAYAVQARVLWNRNTFSSVEELSQWIKGRAKSLASWRYLWAASKEKAYSRILHYLAGVL